MGMLAVRVPILAVRRPYNWTSEAVTEGAKAIRRCIIPLFLAHSGYLIAYGIIGTGALLATLGVVERSAGGLYIAWVREVSTWITAMIFAGVVGSAMTADLGSRKVREELDALAVLGVDRIRSLVVPRVVATTIVGPVLAVFGLFMMLAVHYVVGSAALGFPPEVFRDNLVNTILPLDLLVPLVLKNTIIGFFVGLVSCYKGLSSAPGTEGVGRAVNQAVVITFFGIWLFNGLFNLAYLTLIPDATVLRG
ncbi:MAG: phospholipid/cholesterol/gamma-HCH transport system permease protein [Thermoleophilaceae bacterium]|jgi:phospholipid/cholesterol/gamma-HCH transport system permease protein|nr:phospholipid/cholesterol/gamma-HCH transport system permease protein [Thermoleophilaceae bacterium]